MLSGKFKNCYGLQDFELKQIDFGSCNKSIIYSPNGVMKTSLAKVFEDISKGNETRDRIFKDLKSEYEVKYYASTYKHSDKKSNDEIYVVNSFNDGFELPRESITTLLADTETRKQYDKIVSEFSSEIKEFQDNLSTLSGLSKIKIREQIIIDFKLPKDCDWADLFEALEVKSKVFIDNTLYGEFSYAKIFNEQTQKAYENPTFQEKVGNYIDTLNSLLKENDLLSVGFDDYNAEELGKSFTKHNLFKAEHSIILKDGKTTVKDITEWDKHVSSQLAQLYNNAELSKQFKDLKKLLTANDAVRNLKDIISEKRDIIKLLSSPNELKENIWLHNLSKLDKGFDMYFKKVTEYKEEIKKLYKKASEQKERWENVVNEFNRRFKVPFEVKIVNQANVLLKDEAPNLCFTYVKGKNTPNEKSVDCSKNELMPSLSMGERRAMYLLYILFDLERIKLLAVEGSGKRLIIADDIADSFDYKNKYAIIEYLFDISASRNIDLLILTHNFDFYRTVMSRLDVSRENCYIVQKGQDDNIFMHEFKYRKDVFQNCIITEFKSGRIESNLHKKKCIIASVPFYRNLSEYTIGDTIVFDFLTEILHFKQNTQTIKISDLWNVLKTSFGLPDLIIDDDSKLIIEMIKETADDICSNMTDEVSLENKIVLAMAIRLEAEIFLEKVLDTNGIDKSCSSNQTRKWANRAKQHLSVDEARVIDNVNLMTPESIHINTFMYEPIIDMSDWVLKQLYEDVKQLNVNCIEL